MNIKKMLIATCAVVALTGCGCNKKHSTSTQSYASSMGTASTALTEELEHKIGDRVFYAYNSSHLSEEAKSTLHKQAEFMKAHPELFFTVEGHCDKRGTREYNLGLGERRANSAKRYLVHSGVASDRISTISYGKEQPAVEGDTEEAYSKNRRAVTVIR